MAMPQLEMVFYSWLSSGITLISLIFSANWLQTLHENTIIMFTAILFVDFMADIIFTLQQAIFMELI